ncbi:pleckstrin homology domain-containing family A member 1-like isoform X2 [Clavelina lepadiformis]|uniref:pleckstrin homology domain-containing family A member 1-like isoform X2 n=1 Tax=Clavelina lepadiformis TaxID=159417 RepID=UPI00404251B1
MPSTDSENRTCGYLAIDEEDRRKKFQRRYFILDKSKGLLEWFTDKPTNMTDSSQPCGMLNLDYITIVDEARRMKKNYCFVINTPFRPYYMQARNDDEMNEWIKILNDAGKITVPPEAIHPQVPAIEESECADIQDSSSFSGEGIVDVGETATYRTEIIGNVVIKRKLNEPKELEEIPVSPSFNSTGSDMFPYQQVDNVSLQMASMGVIDDTDVVKRGWAVKQGHVRKNWKRRYFILKNDGFTYYKSEHDKEPLRTIPISEILTARADDGEASKLRDNLLLIATTDKIYYMQADSPDDMTSWIDAFNTAIKANRHLGKTNQVADREGFSLGRSFDKLDEAHIGGHRPLSHFEKRTSSHSIGLQGSSQDSIGYNTCSNDSLDNILESPSLKISEKKKAKAHRRADSEVTFLTTHTVESMTSNIRLGKQLYDPSTYHLENIQSGPETKVLNQRSSSVELSQSSPSSSRFPSANYVASHLDPKVDLRSAVKPSSVKKKKNSGIMFSLNTMLNRKQDRIKKEKTYYSTQRK